MAHPGLPRHVAVIMDGNGRWAQRRALPRHLGHRAGAKAVRACVEGCARRGVEALTVFAFSSENWQRPEDEVTRLMELFVEAIDKEVDELHRNGIRVRFIGDVPRLRPALRRENRGRRGADRAEHPHDLLRRGLLRRALGHRRGHAPPGASRRRRQPAGRTRSTKTRSRRRHSSRVHHRRTSSSAPAASTASAISCSGTWRTPSSISATRSGPTSTTRHSRPRLPVFRGP